MWQDLFKKPTSLKRNEVKWFRTFPNYGFFSFEIESKLDGCFLLPHFSVALMVTIFCFRVLLAQPKTSDFPTPVCLGLIGLRSLYRKLSTLSLSTPSLPSTFVKYLVFGTIPFGKVPLNGPRDHYDSSFRHTVLP